jgi:predicted transcriptional regulator of viral defense system
MQQPNITIPAYIEHLQSKGQYSFSYAQLLSETGKTEKAIERSLSRLRDHGYIASPRKGFYVIVPPEYRQAGCLPATWFIDAMMQFVGETYYVGLLSAAELNGAAHHRPQELQVITERPLRPSICGRSRIRFFSNRHLTTTPTTQHKTRTGFIKISCIEATALDLVRYSFELGGLGAVAAVIEELAEKMKGRDLVKAASNYELAVVQRLGLILESLKQERLAAPLASWLAEQRPRVVLLYSDRASEVAPINHRWSVKVNDALELEP